jgi:uncharacterized protein CbrC (UPF0167 family)
LNAEITDPAGVGDYGSWDAVPSAVINEVAFRTPGFNGWQQERCWTHCGDAAVFLGRAGYIEIETYGSGLRSTLQREIQMEGDLWKKYFMKLNKNVSPTAYVFRCIHCGTYGGYSDCN